MPGLEPSADVIVVGAGVIGLATAYELVLRGLRVRVLERGDVGRGGASWAGGGILSPLDPADTPPPVRALVRESLARYAGWVAELQSRGGVDPEYRRDGLRVHDPDSVEDWVALGHDCGFAVEVGRHAEAVVLECPDVAQVRSPRLLRALAAALRSAGGQVVAGQPVVGISGGPGAQQVTLADGTRQACAQVVVCAGAWSGSLAPLPDLRPVKGQMLLIDAAPGELKRIVLALGVHRNRYLIPRADGPILVGSTVEETGFEDRPTAEAGESLRASAVALMPALASRAVLAHWAGLRPGLPGGIPRLAWCEAGTGSYLHVGHHRLGITLAPASARRAADEIARALGGR